jgi:hypothetical protein
MSVRAAAKSPTQIGPPRWRDRNGYRALINKSYALDRMIGCSWIESSHACRCSQPPWHGCGVRYLGSTYAYAKVPLPLSWLSTRDARVGAYRYTRLCHPDSRPRTSMPVCSISAAIGILESTSRSTGTRLSVWDSCLHDLHLSTDSAAIEAHLSRQFGRHRRNLRFSPFGSD